MSDLLILAFYGVGVLHGFAVGYYFAVWFLKNKSKRWKLVRVVGSV